MRILFVSAYFTYPEVAHGGGTDLFEMIRALSDRHEIHLVSFADPWEIGHVNAMRRYCRTVEVVVPANRWPDKARSALSTIRQQPLQWPFLLGHRSHQELRRHIAEVARRERVDLVQFEWAEAAPFVDAIHGLRVPAILDEVDVPFKPLLHEAQIATTSGDRDRALRRYEASLASTLSHVPRFDLVFTRSESDATLLRSYLPEQRIAVLRPWTRTAEYADVDSAGRQPGTLLFVGLMDRLPNVDAVVYFYHRIFPLIRDQAPEARLLVVGAEPAKAVRDLARDPAVTVTGQVPDLRPYYVACDVFVAPLRIGGGVANKLIDALAAGRPAVATSVANEGVGALPNEAILVGDSPNAFAAQVRLLLRGPLLWHKLAREGRAHVQRTFDWSQTIATLEEHYRDIVEQRRLCAEA